MIVTPQTSFSAYLFSYSVAQFTQTETKGILVLQQFYSAIIEIPNQVICIFLLH